ncbi:hypothetical protein BC829DRAFT_389640 [Chytridium lagenaria]|nr:hypothetical protein BC829DRAFT_389640 [Chytridium lagenaria]
MQDLFVTSKMDVQQLMAQLPEEDQKNVQSMIENLKTAFASMALKRLQLAFDDEQLESHEDGLNINFEDLRRYLIDCGITDITDEMMNALITQAIDTSQLPDENMGGGFSSNSQIPAGIEVNADIFSCEDWSGDGSKTAGIESIHAAKISTESINRANEENSAILSPKTLKQKKKSKAPQKEGPRN